MTFPRPLLLGLFLGALLVLAACGSVSTGAELATAADTDPVETTIFEVTVTTVTPDNARSGFVSDVVTANPLLDGLNEDDLGCVADHLLDDMDPAEVVALTRNGPRPDQAESAVFALRDCDLVLYVVALGIGAALTDHPEALPVDPVCLLEGLTDDDLVPYLRARFETGAVDLDDDEAMDLLMETPMLANAIRCSTEAELYVYDDAPALCAGLADRLGDLIAFLMKMEITAGGEPDLFAMEGVFQITNQIFSWLTDQVPAGLRDDAVLVRDTTGRINSLMVEALVNFSDNVDHTPGDREQNASNDGLMVAFLGVMAQITVELEADIDEVVAASARLEDWTVTQCGESSSMLFDLLAGVGA